MEKVYDLLLWIILDASSSVSGYSSNIRLIPCSIVGYCLQIRPYLPMGVSSMLITCTCGVWESTHNYDMRVSSLFSVNVWCGIVDNYMLGPHVLPPRLTGPVYRQCVEHELPGLLHEDVQLATRNSMWFKHDGTPTRFSHVLLKFWT